ncbi:MAG: sugar phosphate isomerase/epimerase [Planctomycetes bacterium]|nr:sugar phosphate isomerase/epimerase [Planctomycetota bacterium]
MKLKWAFASATVMKLPWDDEFKLWKKYKWKAVEIWFDKVKACMEQGRTCAELGSRMHDAGIRPIGVAPGVVWTPASGHDPRHEMGELTERLDVTLALGAEALTIVVLGKGGPDPASEYDRVADKLRKVAEMAARRGLRLNLEFLAGLPINGAMGSCIELLQKVDHPAVGMLLDLCHYYASPSHVEELSRLPKGKLFLVHVADAQNRPMEILGCEHRCFPGEGRIDVPALLAEIRTRTRYNGYFSVELYDKDVWEMKPDQVFKKTADSIKAIRKALKGKAGKRK